MPSFGWEIVAATYSSSELLAYYQMPLRGVSSPCASVPLCPFVPLSLFPFAPLSLCPFLAPPGSPCSTFHEIL